MGKSWPTLIGALKRVNPVSRLTAGIETWDELMKQKINEARF